MHPRAAPWHPAITRLVATGVLAALAACPAGSLENDRPLVVSGVQPLGAGARPAWSPRGDLLAYDRAGPDGRHDVYLADQEGKAERCLTCSLPDLRTSNNLRPSFRADGAALVILVQRHARKLALDERSLATPLRGLHADLYQVRPDGRDYWQLTRLGELGDAALDPRCAWDGELVLFGHRTAARAGRFGHWEPMVARVEMARGTARFGKARRLLRGPAALVLPLEWSSDDRSVLVAANLDGQDESGLDLYRIPLSGGAPERLTTTPNQLDEYAHMAPDGRHLVWSTNRGLFPRSTPRTLAPGDLRDLWVLDTETGDAERLTYFSGEGRAESLGEAWVGDFSFHPDGRALVVSVLARHRSSPAAVAPAANPVSSRLYRVELATPPGSEAPR